MILTFTHPRGELLYSLYVLSQGDNMGRTVPTYRMVLEWKIWEWNRIRRFLSKESQEALDSVLFKARHHADAASFATFVDPAQAMYLCILMETERELWEMKMEICKEIFDRNMIT